MTRVQHPLTTTLLHAGLFCPRRGTQLTFLLVPLAANVLKLLKRLASCPSTDTKLGTCLSDSWHSSLAQRLSMRVLRDKIHFFVAFLQLLFDSVRFLLFPSNKQRNNKLIHGSTDC